MKLDEIIERIRNNDPILTSLKLWHNNIDEPGAKALAKALKTNTTLTTLNLQNLHIGDPGAKALAEALKANTTLTSLELWGNKISELGAKTLAEALKANTTLISLNLGFNNIGNSGAKALAEALKTNATLTNLNLWFNDIDESGVKALANALKNNFTLLSLDGVTHPDISSYLKRNKAIADFIKSLICSMDNPELMDAAFIEKNLGDLKRLIPSLGREKEALDDEHPATESYRLLTALGYRLQEGIDDKSRAISYLSVPFKNTFLQALADRVLGELLYVDILPQTPEGEEKTALLYALLYRLANSAQRPEHAIIIYDSLLQLQGSEGRIDPVRIRELEDNTVLLNHQAIVRLAAIALKPLKPGTDVTIDKQALELLTVVQHSKQVSPAIIQDLMCLPVFMDVLKTQYPDKNQFVCLGSYQMPYTMIYSLTAPNDITLQWEHRDTNLKNQPEFLKTIQEAIKAYLVWMTANTKGTRGLTRFSHWYHGESGVRRARELLDKVTNPKASDRDIISQLAQTLDESSNARHSLKRYVEEAVGNEELKAIINEFAAGDTCQYSR